MEQLQAYGPAAIGFAAILYAVSVVVRVEKVDLTCPEGPYTKDRTVCGDGNGKSYGNTKPNVKDNNVEVIQKIKKLARSLREDICWRKAFIASFIMMVLIFLFVFRRIPEAIEMFGVMFVCMVTGWLFYSFYNSHHYKHIEYNLLGNANVLEDRINRLKRK